MASAVYRKGAITRTPSQLSAALDAFGTRGRKPRWARSTRWAEATSSWELFPGPPLHLHSVEVRMRHQTSPALFVPPTSWTSRPRSGDYLKTIDNLNRSLGLRERIGDFPGLNPTLVILGDLYFRLGRYEQALVYFRREVENSQKIGDTRGLVEAFAQLGRVFLELGDLKQAESLSKHSIACRSKCFFLARLRKATCGAWFAMIED